MARIKLGAAGAARSDCSEALSMAKASGADDVATEAEQCVRLAEEAKAKTKSSHSSRRGNL